MGITATLISILTNSIEVYVLNSLFFVVDESNSFFHLPTQKDKAPLFPSKSDRISMLACKLIIYEHHH